MRGRYLGSDLNPDQYYSELAHQYSNPHEPAIAELLRWFKPFLHSRILDIGCGDGLATRLVGQTIGIDRSPEMILRFKEKTKCEGLVGNFWDVMPQSDVAMAVYCLHLCPDSRMHQFKWRLKEAGIQTLVVVSPFKRTKDLGLPIIQERKSSAGPDGKVVWGWAMKVCED